ncbi:MAG TPA: hypothetical protein VN893_06325, partial [Bryobacteraceae bacterium]|nr:hypothetical protein [Bryobacteraceae bacterium]
MGMRNVSLMVICALSVRAGLWAQDGPNVEEGKKADFSRLVVAGDSLTAGYQNSQLIFSGQIHGYANVIASRAGVGLNLPLLPAPGFPQVSIVDGFAVATGIQPVARENNQQTRDVAVPGFT